MKDAITILVEEEEKTREVGKKDKRKPAHNPRRSGTLENRCSRREERKP